MSAFDRIIGYEAVKKELYQIIDMLKNKELYEKMGAKFPKGVLIYGAPGLGKTMLAEALIDESKIKSYVLKKNKPDEELIKEINNVFEEATKQSASIILIDDIDKFSSKDEKDCDDDVFVTLQSGIDSVRSSNVLVVATANNIGKLPISLKRSGRFDRKIEMTIPSDEDARKIIEYYLKTKCVNENLNYEDVAKMISYTSCADLETLLNEAAINATYLRKDSIDIDDIVKAYLRSVYKIADEVYNCTKEEIESVSLHEAGHAVIAEVLQPGSVGLISFKNNNSSLQGFTRMCKELKRRPENIVTALGGKVAVEQFYQGRCGSGCQSDINTALMLLYSGIDGSGTCGLGFISVEGVNRSEMLTSKTEAAVHAELERYMFVARDILLKNKDFLMQLAEKLREKKTLLYSDIQNIKKNVQITTVEV